MRNVSDKSCWEAQNTFYVRGLFFSGIVPFIRKCGKICRAGQTIGDNTVHVHYMLDT